MRRVLIALGVAPLMAGTAIAAQPLTDQQMDKVIAGDNFTINLGTLEFNFTENLGGGTLNFAVSLGTSSLSVLPNLSLNLCGAACVLNSH